jgi:prephenate dehydratase
LLPRHKDRLREYTDCCCRVRVNYQYVVGAGQPTAPTGSISWACRLFLASGRTSDNFISLFSAAIWCIWLPLLIIAIQAALEYFDKTADLHPHPSFAAIFNALQNPSFLETPEITYAIVPIENSSNGTVVSLLDLLADPENKYYNIKVCAEHYLAVHHYLLVPREQKLHEETERSHLLSIKTLYTHPQVWTQCTRYLSTHLAHAERIDTSSTSAAASYLNSPQANGSDAAIGSALAAQTMHVDILAHNIEDDPNNTTRFLVLQNSQTLPASPPILNTSRKQKSLITFTLNHSQPGSLASALQSFKQHNFNLTSIDTRPSRQLAWHYIFCVECETLPDTYAEKNSESLVSLLSTLRQTTERSRYLGTWADALEQ